MSENDDSDQLMTALGFLASQEVKDAGVGNLGLQDRPYFFRHFIGPVLKVLQNAKR